MRCSAPGKIYLFGEHAVVYGKKAIACAIDIRTYVEVGIAEESVVTSVFGTAPLESPHYPYMRTAVNKIKEIEEINDVQIHVDSQIPVGTGLGSSAAVTIATLEALNIEFEIGIPREELARIGHSVELEVQGSASPTDTWMSTMGGTWQVPDRRKLEPPSCAIVVGDTCIAGNTGQLVGGVRRLYDKYSFMEQLIDTFDMVATEGARYLKSGDYQSLGELMNINQGLLDAVGVGHPSATKLIYAAREAGAWGAKITGAGGGGCIVAITDDPVPVVEAIKDAGGNAYVTEISLEGVRRE